MKYVILVNKETVYTVGPFDTKEQAEIHLLNLANELETDLAEPYETPEDVLVLNPDYEIIPLKTVE